MTATTTTISEYFFFVFFSLLFIYCIENDDLGYTAPGTQHSQHSAMPIFIHSFSQKGPNPLCYFKLLIVCIYLFFFFLFFFNSFGHFPGFGILTILPQPIDRPIKHVICNNVCQSFIFTTTG